MTKPKGQTHRHPALLLVGGSLTAIVVLTLLLIWTPRNGPGSGRDNGTGGNGGSLLFYCAAGIREPVQRVVEEYQTQYGTSIELQFGGSGTLLSNLATTRRGDLYLAADRSYLERAHERGLVEESIPLAKVLPVIAFPKGNPKNITSLDDLLREDVSVALGNPDAASIGETTKAALEKSGHWEELEHRAKVFKPTVNEVANDIKLGAVDAGIVWNATVAQYPELEMQPVSALNDEAQEVTIGVLSSCRQPTQALHFARYLAAETRGLQEFARAGYDPVEGDKWAEVPELTFYCGGINRLAVQETIRKFQQREGVQINVNYNGCGILVGMMKAGQTPDAYFACTKPFMNQVSGTFRDIVDLSESDVVILVPSGNPDQIASLSDLAQPGLKLGVTNPEQSALGAQTQQMFEDSGIAESVRGNISTQQPTADALVTQMRAGALDAAIVFEANTANVRGELEVVRIDHPLARAVQPFAIHRNSQYPRLAQRLLEALKSSESQAQFESVGFRWLVQRQWNE